jgi:polyhydroxyalkanoate synthase
MAVNLDLANRIRPAEKALFHTKDTVASSRVSPAEATVRSLDRPLHAATARLTGGISPAALTQAYTDWLQHLLFSPDKQIELVGKAADKWVRYLQYCVRACSDPTCPDCIEPLAEDARFRSEAWQLWPFNAMYQGFLLTQQWWHSATTDVEGVSKHHQDIVSFTARQILDVLSPVNFPLTNPAVIDATLKQGGMNFVRGAFNFWEDWRRSVTGEKPVGTDAFKVGSEVAGQGRFSQSAYRAAAVRPGN